jgi:ribosomal protein S18 acetylase RimI-like enzyme
VTGEVLIRRSDESNVEFIVEMARHASVIEDRPLPPADDPDVVVMLPTASDCAVIAVTDEGQSLGAAWCSVRLPALVQDETGEPVPEMTIAVVPEARGRGIGTALIEALAREAAYRYRELALNVHLRNPAARLYTRTGFRVAGAGRGWYGVAMRRSLTTVP